MMILRKGVVSVSGGLDGRLAVDLAPGAVVPELGTVVVVPDPRWPAAGRVIKVVRASNGTALTLAQASLADAYSTYRIAAHGSLANLHALYVTKTRVEALNAASLGFLCSHGGPSLHNFDFSDTHVDLYLSIIGPSISFMLKSNPHISVGLFLDQSDSCHLPDGAWITIPIADVPGLFVKLSPVLSFSASGKIDVDYTWNPRIVVGFVKGQNLSANEYHGFGQSSDVSVRVAAGASLFAGLNASIEYGGRVGVGGTVGGKLTGSVSVSQGKTCLGFDGALHAALTATASVFKKNWSFTLAQGDFGHLHIGDYCIAASTPGGSPPPGGGGSPPGGGGLPPGSGSGSPPTLGGGAGPLSSVTVAQGPPAPKAGYGYFYAITLHNFAPNSLIPLTCFDTRDPGGYEPTTIKTNASGYAFTQDWCYSSLGPEYWVVAGGVTSNHARWGSAPGTSPPPSGPGVSETTGPAGSGTFPDVHESAPVGTRIGGNVTVQVSCRATGIAVADGTNWWYLVSSSPWNNQWYASADNFYNNGQKTGSVNTGVIVDTAVPLCNGTPAPPQTGGGSGGGGQVPLAPPTGVAGKLTSSTSFSLNWNPVVGAVSYVLYLDGKTLLTTQLTSFDFGAFKCGETHLPGVQAAAADGRVSSITTTTVSTAACSTGGGGGGDGTGGPEPTPLPAPTSVAATVNSQQHLVLSWAPVAQATEYNVYLDGQFVTRVSAATYDFGAVPCGRTFSPGVQALAAAGGQVSTVASVMATTPACANTPPDTTPPSVPGGLTVYFPSNTGFTLGWTPATDNVGVTAYTVFLNGANVATVPAGSTVAALGSIGYVFSGLSCGTTYSVGVAASDAAGNTSSQGTVNASTAACPSSIPPPTGVQATVDATNHVTVSWNAVSGAVGYFLWLNGARLLETSGTSFPYGQLTCGQTYTIGVQTDAGSGQVSSVATTTATTNHC